MGLYSGKEKHKVWKWLNSSTKIRIIISLVLLVDWPQEVVKMIGLVFQKVNLLSSLLVLSNLLVLDLLFECFFLLLQLFNLLLIVDLFLLKVSNGCLQFGSPLLGLKLFSHGEGERWFVKHLIGVDGHVELIPHSHEKNSSFRTVDGDLPDDLIIALFVKLFPDGADPWISILGIFLPGLPDN